MQKNGILVSICMITYNHESYIAQAIEGVLMQKTTLPTELIIGEDCSTDRTRVICEEYASIYPDIIILLPSDRNLGITQNFIRTLKACNGKYIALCEGDDYWTDPYKLQKQIDFLEINSEYTGCAHQTTVIYEDRKKEPHEFRSNIPEIITINELLSKRIFHTASFVFISEIIRKHSLPTNIIAGDRALFLLIASFGKIKFIRDSMAVYRKNSSGISSWVTIELMEKDINIVAWIYTINPNFPKYRYLSFIYSTILTYPQKIALKKIIRYYLLFVIYSLSDFPKNLKKTIYFSSFVLPKILIRNINY